MTSTQAWMLRRRVEQRPALQVIDEPLPLLASRNIVRRDPDREVRGEANGAQIEEDMVQRAQRAR